MARTDQPVVELATGPVRIVGINSNAPPLPGSAARARVLDALTRGDPWWRLAFFHHPPWSAGEMTGHPGARWLLHGLVADAGTDIVFNGHSHTFQRRIPVDARGRPDPAGVRYVISGGGGGRLYGAGDGEGTEAFGYGYHFIEVVARGGELWLRARSVDDETLDRVRLVRSAPGEPAAIQPWTEPPPDA